MDYILHPSDCDKLQPTSKQDTSEIFVMRVRHLPDESNNTAMPQLERFDNDTFTIETEEMPVLEISDESEDENPLNFSNDIKLEVEEHELPSDECELETEQELEFEEHERELHSNDQNLEAEQELEIGEHELEVQERNDEAREDDLCSIFDGYSSCSSDIWDDINTVMNGSKLDDNNELENNKRKRIRQRAVCHICGLVLSRIDHLKIHIQGVHDSNKVYKCTHCDHTTNSKLYLQRHFKLNHSFITELFSCTYCNFKTHKILYLKNHVKRNHTNHEKKYVCDFCGFETAEKFHFYSHMKDVHEKNGDKINKCNRCPFQTRWKSHLYLHIKTKHTEKNAEITYHNCEECLFQTRWKSHLYKHMKDKHSLDRPLEYYNCENCDFQTKWQSHLYKHRKTKHPGVIYQRRHSRPSLANHENIQKLSNKSAEEVQEDIEEMIETFNDKKRKRSKGASLKQTDRIENSKHIEMKNMNQSGTFTSVWESFVYSCDNEEAENKRMKLGNEKGIDSNDEEGIGTKDEGIKHNLRKKDSKNVGNITKKEVTSNKKQSICGNEEHENERKKFGNDSIDEEGIRTKDEGIKHNLRRKDSKNIGSITNKEVTYNNKKQSSDKMPEKLNIDESREFNKDDSCNADLCKIQTLNVIKRRSEESKIKTKGCKGKAKSRKSKARESEGEKKENLQNEEVEGYECSDCSFKTQRMSKLKTHKSLAHAKK